MEDRDRGAGRRRTRRDGVRRRIQTTFVMKSVLTGDSSAAAARPTGGEAFLALVSRHTAKWITTAEPNEAPAGAARLPFNANRCEKVFGNAASQNLSDLSVSPPRLRYQRGGVRRRRIEGTVCDPDFY